MTPKREIVYIAVIFGRSYARLRNEKKQEVEAKEEGRVNKIQLTLILTHSCGRRLMLLQLSLIE
jgi:hypothetical protein